MIVIHRFGRYLADGFLAATEEEWDRVFTVNAKGTFLCYKYAGIQVIAQGRGGRIIGASSLSGKRGDYPMYDLDVLR